jgi:c-di-GMP-binding flagellar brake protein YcgR
MERRSVVRQTVAWDGMFRIDNGSETPWRLCRIMDISPGGATLVPRDAISTEITGATVVVCLPVLHDFAIQLAGEVRHVTTGVESAPLVGIQFCDLSSSERDFLASIRAMRAMSTASS